MSSSQIKIGFFDSGIGGFSILKEVQKAVPEARYFYISNCSNSSFGNKEDAFILEKCEQLTKELLKESVDLIVVACNTATTIAISELRKKFTIPFVGVEPFVNILNKNKNELSKYLLLSTRGTYDSERFAQLKTKFDPNGEIAHYPCLNLAKIIEDFYVHRNKEKLYCDVKRELSFIKKDDYSHAILGCTHYALVRPIIEDILGVSGVCPAKAVAKQVRMLTLKLPPALQGESFFSFKQCGEASWYDKSFTEIILV